MEYHTHSATLAALGSGLAVRGQAPCLVLINQGRDHRNIGGCKGGSSIATYSAPVAPAARVSRSSKEAEWLGWVGNSLSRHMTQAMDTWLGALQVDRLGTCRHHSVHSMQGSSRTTRATCSLSGVGTPGPPAHEPTPRHACLQTTTRPSL